MNEHRDSGSQGEGRSQEHHSCEALYHDDLAAYALGALPGPEVERLEAHLTSCEACQGRLRWLEPAVDLVPATVPQLEPPPELRERLMATVRAEAAPSPAQQDGGESRWRRWFRLPDLTSTRGALAGLAAALLLVAGLGGYLLRGGEETQSFAVTPESGVAREASGTVEVSDGSGSLFVEGMPPIDGDRVYQVWVAEGGEMEPSSIFVVRPDGSGSTAIPEIPESAEAIVITREPAGGSEVPHSGPLMRATFD